MVEFGFWKLAAKYWYHAVLILFGAATYATLQWKAAKDRRKQFSWQQGFAAFIVGTFSGTVFSMAASNFFSVEGGQLGVVGAIGAVLGIGGIKLLNDIFASGVKAKFNVKSDSGTDTD